MKAAGAEQGKWRQRTKLTGQVHKLAVRGINSMAALAVPGEHENVWGGTVTVTRTQGGHQHLVPKGQGRQTFCSTSLRAQKCPLKMTTLLLRNTASNTSLYRGDLPEITCINTTEPRQKPICNLGKLPNPLSLLESGPKTNLCTWVLTSQVLLSWTVDSVYIVPLLPQFSKYFISPLTTHLRKERAELLP